MNRLALAAACLVLTTTVATAETRFEAGRRAYAVMEAGSEYCPEIELTWTARMLVLEGYGYDSTADEAEFGRLQLAKQKLFDTFRTVPRMLVCEMLMDEFGPGGRLHLFQFR